MQGQSAGKDGKPGRYRQVKIETPELYDLDADVAESKNVADANPDVVKKLLSFAEEARDDLGDALTKRVGKGVREPGRLADAKNPANPDRKGGGDQPEFAAELVFPLHKQHNHAPGIVECPNGDLFVSWYRGSGERSADDVAVYGARKKAGAEKWSDEFLMVDTPGFPDCNTTMWVDKDGKLWLFWPVILANSWESCLTHYRVSSDYQKDRRAEVGVAGEHPPQAEGLRGGHAPRVRGVEEAGRRRGEGAGRRLTDEVVKKRVSDKLLSRLGWQPRCKPTVLAIRPHPSAALLGHVFRRDHGDQRRRRQDVDRVAAAGRFRQHPARGARTQGRDARGVHARERPLQEDPRRGIEGRRHELGHGVLNRPAQPGSGLDAVRLANGNWLLIYNDTLRGRASLAVSLSDDEGKTWKWTRHLEKHDDGVVPLPGDHPGQGRRDSRDLQLLRCRRQEHEARRGSTRPGSRRAINHHFLRRSTDATRPLPRRDDPARGTRHGRGCRPRSRMGKNPT